MIYASTPRTTTTRGRGWRNRCAALAVNSADDLINPPELGILEREIMRVPHGRAIVIPFSEHTHGHGSHTYATLWREELVKLLDAAPERLAAAGMGPELLE